MADNIFSRLRRAYNAYTGRFVSIGEDGFPAWGYTSNSGIYINAESAMRVSTVYSCVSLLSQVIASIPLVLYEKHDSVEEARKNPLYKLLKHKPNEYQTAYDYWMYNLECMLLRGGFISWKNTVGNRTASMIPLNPDEITREVTPDGRLVFSGKTKWGNRQLSFDQEPQSSFFWCNYRTRDGISPQSVISSASEAMGLALTAETHGARVFKNDATPPLVIEHPQKLSPEALLNLSKMWKRGGSGDNYGMPRFVDGGAKITRLAMSNEDAQCLETRRFQKEEICGIFRVPPSMIGDTQRAQGWSTLEQKNSDFLTYTLMPYLENIEQAVDRSLIPEKDWDTIYADFDTDELMKADVRGRTTYYTTMFNIGALSPNEIRSLEGYNKRDGGDEYKSASAPAVTIQKENEDEDASDTEKPV